MIYVLLFGTKVGGSGMEGFVLKADFLCFKDHFQSDYLIGKVYYFRMPDWRSTDCHDSYDSEVDSSR
ncbi:hypothetical protein Dfri01_07430 [Dyadobacter frigoris]|nr:hypothetical protein Dfri01_07430 [Dyadobacter frigoris]